MKFYENQLFHIYNQGNNRQQIFFTDENYYFFLWKLRTYLPPFGSIVSYCLMPNHFHLQFYVESVAINRKEFWVEVDNIEYQRRQSKYGIKAQKVERSGLRINDQEAVITLNEAVGQLQKSYTKALNKEKGWTGSLFRKNCKAKDGWIDEFITLRKSNGKLDSRFMPGTGYAHHCFNYIHQNPVAAGLVVKATDWRFSSARDYAGLRNGTLCNLNLGREIIENL